MMRMNPNVMRLFGGPGAYMRGRGLGAADDFTWHPGEGTVLAPPATEGGMAPGTAYTPDAGVPSWGQTPAAPPAEDAGTWRLPTALVIPDFSQFKGSSLPLIGLGVVAVLVVGGVVLASGKRRKAR